MFDFKNFFDALKEDSLMGDITGQFAEMIEDARWMFETTGGALLEGQDPLEHKDAIYERDIRINKAERSIRKKIIEHLAINPGPDLGTCLVLFSSVKDAERLGDYCKNLLELAILIGEARYPEHYYPRIKSMYGSILNLFPVVSSAFNAVDEAGARQVIEQVTTINKECDAIVEEVIRGADALDARGAVATTLTVRYFKRTAAHIKNIATGLVNPVHKIDFNK